MKRTTIARAIIVAILVVCCMPVSALAISDDFSTSDSIELSQVESQEKVQKVADAASSQNENGSNQLFSGAENTPSILSLIQSNLSDACDAAAPSLKTRMVQTAVHDTVQAIIAARVDKVLPYSAENLAVIGTQESTGHTICCPSFSCAYADAVLDGTVHDHAYYGCGCCVWTDWGGGNSSFRSVGTSEQLLREAYDNIAAGKPTVIHVSASYGEHWIALIGYQNAVDPNQLTLDNFIAIDPWDGDQIVASNRFTLYGDGCEHVSER